MATKKQFPLSVIIGAVDRITAPMQRIQGKLKRFMVPVEKLRRSMRKLGDAAGFRRMGIALGRVGKSMRRVGAEAGALLKRFAAISAVAIGLAAKLVIDFARGARETQAWANRLGVTVGYLQEMQYVGKQFNVTQDAIIDGMKELSLRADEFVVTGKGSAAEAFQRLNITAQELRKTGGETEKILALVSTRIRQVENVSARQRIADELFGGQGGEQLTEMLSASADEIARLRKEARDLGYVMSARTAKAAVRFDQAMQRMLGALQGVRNIIGAELLPVVERLFTRLTDYLVKNQGRIAEWAKEFGKSLPTFDQVQAAVLRVVDELRPLINLVAWISKNLGVVNTLLLVFAATIGGKLVLAVLQAAAAIKALGLAISLTPVGWFLAAIAAIAGAVYLIYKNWDGIVAYFTGKFERVKKAFKDGFLKGLWSLVTEFNPIQILIDTLDSLIEKLTGFSIKDAVKGLVQSINPFADDEREERRPAPRMRPGAGVLQSSRNGERSEAKVLVDFTNLPRGARVERDRTSTGDVDLSMGYQMQGAQ